MTRDQSVIAEFVRRWPATCWSLGFAGIAAALAIAGELKSKGVVVDRIQAPLGVLLVVYVVAGILVGVAVDLIYPRTRTRVHGMVLGAALGILVGIIVYVSLRPGELTLMQLSKVLVVVCGPMGAAVGAMYWRQPKQG